MLVRLHFLSNLQNKTKKSFVGLSFFLRSTHKSSNIDSFNKRILLITVGGDTWGCFIKSKIDFIAFYVPELFYRIAKKEIQRGSLWSGGQRIGSMVGRSAVQIPHSAVFSTTKKKLLN